MAIGCSESDVTDPSPQAEAPASTSLSDAELVSRGLALALANSDLRLRVLADLRDSAYPAHSVPLERYLRSDRGRPVAEAARAELDSMGSEFDDALGRIGLNRLFMPVRHQRTTWKGEGPVAVAVWTSERVLTTEARNSEAVIPAWTSAGESAAVPWFQPPEYVMFGLQPVDSSFLEGVGEGRIRSATKERPTVARSRLESGEDAIAAPSLRSLETGSDVGYKPGSVYLPDSVTYSQCRNVDVLDADFDSLEDYCEWELAQAFAPLIWFDDGECCRSMQSYFAARLVDALGYEESVGIFYALGYNDDSGHIGDSEWISLFITFQNGRWYLLGGHYSAHWQAIGDRSNTYFADEFEYPGQRQGRPIAYSANGKHANYNTADRCHLTWQVFWADHCGKARGTYVTLAGNLGGGHPWERKLEDCVGSWESEDSEGHFLDGRECFWSHDTFDGWHHFGDGSGVTPYREALDYFGWISSGDGDPDPPEDGYIIEFEPPETDFDPGCGDNRIIC